MKKKKILDSYALLVYLILFSLPISKIHPDFELIIESAKLKAKHTISYADTFVAATAIKENAIILTGDPEFKQLKHIVEIEWI